MLGNSGVFGICLVSVAFCDEKRWQFFLSSSALFHLDMTSVVDGGEASGESPLTQQMDGQVRSFKVSRI